MYCLFKDCIKIFKTIESRTDCMCLHKYEGRTESHEQLFFAGELGTADEGECGGRWNQLLCYP